MFVALNLKLKLRPSVAVVAHDKVTEFFLSNIRKSINIEIDGSVVGLLFKLDGKKSIYEWMIDADINEEDKNDCLRLLHYLVQNHILIIVDEPYVSDYELYPRVFTLLEDYSESQSLVNRRFKKLQHSNVLIIGLGSVGTWVTQCLLMDGLSNFILVDPDNVDLSNIHRQNGFTEKSIGFNKTDAFKEHLLRINPNVNVETISDTLDDHFFKSHIFPHVDLIINCADSPTVDITSRIVGEYAMSHGIPHIIGGGYNLHQSLIGQVVIPGKTACLECFRRNLDELNEIDTSNITKLYQKDRKIGSFPPLSALSSSITANEAFKVLAGIEDTLAMSDSRTEFLLRDLNFTNVYMIRRTDCEWCGTNGKYYQLQ